MVKHIVCVGAVYIDTILSVPHFPIEDQKLRAKKITRRRGGNGANTLEVLTQLVDHQTAKLHILSVLPAKGSNAVEFVRNSLGDDVRLDKSCIFRDGHTEAASSYIIQNEQTITRTIVSINELPEMIPTEFVDRVATLKEVEKVDEGWYHFEGRIPDVTLQCVRSLRDLQPACKISVECEKPERRQMSEVAQLADVVFYSKLWATSNGFNNTQEFLRDQCLHTKDDALLCCTWGSGGATLVQKRGNGDHTWSSSIAWTPGQEVASVVDTIGAGDTFIAGMLFALNYHEHDWSLYQKISFSNELAGRKVIQEGFSGLGKKISIPVPDCDDKGEQLM